MIYIHHLNLQNKIPKKRLGRNVPRGLKYNIETMKLLLNWFTSGVKRSPWARWEWVTWG